MGFYLCHLSFVRSLSSALGVFGNLCAEKAYGRCLTETKRSCRCLEAVIEEHPQIKCAFFLAIRSVFEVKYFKSILLPLVWYLFSF